MAVIAVDFDGTLFNEDEEGQLYLIDGAREALESFKEQGHTIVIYSARPFLAHKSGGLKSRQRELEWMYHFLMENNIPFDEIYPGDKFVADFYIDDRAIGFNENWSEIEKNVSKKKKSA